MRLEVQARDRMIEPDDSRNPATNPDRGAIGLEWDCEG
jgi:hypothetical protein